MHTEASVGDHNKQSSEIHKACLTMTVAYTLSGKKHNVKGTVRYRLATIKCGDIDSLPADIDVKHQLHAVDRNVVNQWHSRAT